MNENGTYEVGGGYPGYRDPTPWGPGITVAVFVGLLSAVGIYAFGIALARVHPLLAILVNAVAAGGVAPTIWRWRATPVWRWVLGGGVAGVVVAWVVLVVTGLTAL